MLFRKKTPEEKREKRSKKLHDAISFGNFKRVQSILGKDPALINFGKVNPLDLALKQNNRNSEKIVDFLLQKSSPSASVTQSKNPESNTTSNLLKENEDDGYETPDEFYCPISFEPMEDPITPASTGISYNRNSLKDYFIYKKNPDTLPCPKSGKPIQRSECDIPTTFALKRLIDAHYEKKEKKKNTTVSSNDPKLFSQSQTKIVSTATTHTTSSQSRSKSK